MRDISGKAERPVTSSEVTVASLLDHLDVGVIMLDVTGRILMWSPLAEKILGWPGDQVIGRRLISLFEEQREGTPEQHRPAVLGAGDEQEIYDTLLREQYWHGLVRFRHADGRPVEIESGASLLLDSQGKPFVLVNIVQTSRLRDVEQDLIALDAFYASSALGVAIFDTHRRYVRVNAALARLHGRSPDEIIGKTLYDLLPEPTATELSRLQATVLETGEPVLDHTMPGITGRSFLSVSYSRLTDRYGRILGISATVMDVSERREAIAKIERGRHRLKLLDDVGVTLGELLDVRRIGQALTDALVPRFADYAGVVVHGTVVHGGELATVARHSDPVVKIASSAKDSGPLVDQVMASGGTVGVIAGTVFGTVLRTGVPRLIDSQQELRAAAAPGSDRARAAAVLGINSLLAVPLTARGVVLGVLVMSRAVPRDPFDREDLALAQELASRAGISLENARLYAGERETALMLQRSLLPQWVPSPPGMRVAYRYVPGSSGAEVGGDWFDVMPLAGGRAALVVGDVMGHGLRAAATMGRLRTAVRTLAGLDLAPEELLRRVNDLTDDLVPGTQDPLTATCVYAVYDPSTRRCAMATAGHVPPLLLTAPVGGERWRATPLALPTGAPLGVGGVCFESRELEVEEGAVLVLYTDGLVETRDEDITEGINRLCSRLSQADRTLSLEEVCDDIVASMSRQTDGDDVALLMAQLGGLPAGSSVSWTFPAQAPAVRRARGAVRRTLGEWGLEAISDEAELLVSELVTNSLRYAHGPIGVRMVYGTSLLVEVSDPLPDPPRERATTTEDEGGRGMQLVVRESRRWGTRHGPLGKTVWFELTLPG